MNSTQPNHLRASFKADFALGVRTWMASWQFIAAHRLWVFFLYPFLLSLFLGMGLFGTFFHLAQDAVSAWWDVPPFAWQSDQSLWHNLKTIFQTFSSAIASVLLLIVAFLVAGRVYKYAMLILLSPFMAYISERTEEALEGKRFPFRLHHFLQDIGRGVLLALRNLFLELGLVMVIWAAGGIISMVLPPLALLVAPMAGLLSLFIGAYYFGFSTLDYSLERQRFGWRERVRVVRRARGLAISNGLIFQLLMWMPWIGLIVASVTCTVGAHLAAKEKGWLNAQTQP
jgi:CysZ protein